MVNRLQTLKEVRLAAFGALVLVPSSSSFSLYIYLISVPEEEEVGLARARWTFGGVAVVPAR